MAYSERSPDARGTGAGKDDQLGSAINSQDSIFHLQVQRLVRRYMLTEPHAAVIARHAFGGGADDGGGFNWLPLGDAAAAVVDALARRDAK